MEEEVSSVRKEMEISIKSALCVHVFVQPREECAGREEDDERGRDSRVVHVDFFVSEGGGGGHLYLCVCVREREREKKLKCVKVKDEFFRLRKLEDNVFCQSRLHFSRELQHL